MMTRALSILAAVLLLPACASTWQDQYQGAPKGTHAPTQTVTVREVPWVRVNSALQNLESQRAMSDTHPDEWTSEQRAAEHTTLLTALQISEPPETVTILGRSVFRSTDRLTPTDGSLSDFARSIGADYAVYAVNYLGTKKVAQQEPVHETGSLLPSVFFRRSTCGDSAAQTGAPRRGSPAQPQPRFSRPAGSARSCAARRSALPSLPARSPSAASHPASRTPPAPRATAPARRRSGSPPGTARAPRPPRGIFATPPRGCSCSRR
jgi:hypothetical protein